MLPFFPTRLWSIEWSNLKLTWNHDTPHRVIHAMISMEVLYQFTRIHPRPWHPKIHYGCPPARHCYQRSISCSAHRSHRSSLKSALQPIIDFVSILQCSRNTLGFCLKYIPFSMFLAYSTRTAHDVHLDVANQINREPIMLCHEGKKLEDTMNDNPWSTIR